MWKSVCRVVARAIANGNRIGMAGLANVWLLDLAECQAWDEVHKVYYTRKPSKRVVFKTSTSLKHLLKEYLENEIFEEEIETDDDEEDELDT